MPEQPSDQSVQSVCVYWYSQTGQLREALSALVSPLERAGLRVDWHEIEPRVAYPFPWSPRAFFGLFPDASDPTATVDLAAPPQPPGHTSGLIIVGFQVWYLAPSLPIRALLNSGLFQGRDVVGVTACRNMWYSAALKVRERLVGGGARYLGTVAAVDDAPTAVTFVTTLRWLLRGRKDAFWGLPAAGVGQREHERLTLVGERLASELTAGPGPVPEDWTERVNRALTAAPAVPFDAWTAAADLFASSAFRLSGRLIRGRRTVIGRHLALGAFVVGLGCGIVLFLPALAVLNLVVPSWLRSRVMTRMEPVLARKTQTTIRPDPLAG
jgi:hypothetical protein